MTEPLQDGLLLVDKTSGCTSHDVVAATRRLLRQKKIGHCGTLDPDATGLLLLTLGRATRLTRFLIRAPKVYEGQARLGITTDTYDLAGEIVHEATVEHIGAEEVRQAMERFVGTYLQTPPPYCAKKIGGVKYYELARRGEEVPDTKKEVTIFEFRTPQDFRPGHDLPFVLGCTSGTYARSLVHELGQALGCGATLASLNRTQIGGFKLERAITLDTLQTRIEIDDQTVADAAGNAWIPFDDIELPFAQIMADRQQERRIKNGQTVLVRDLESREGDWLKVTNERHQLIAVGSVVERIGTGGVGVIQPKVVFH